MAKLDKDPAILAVLVRLRSALGPDAFVLADHWEPDRCAIGIASLRDPGVLVYISFFRELHGRFGYELELPPPHGSDELYEVVGRGEGVTFEELVSVAKAHLSRA